MQPRDSVRANERPRLDSAVDVLRPPAYIERRVAHRTGFLLADLAFDSFYANDAALQILRYPRESTPEDAPFLQQRIQSILKAERFRADLLPADFHSGRRSYVCRPFLVESGGQAPMVALLLEQRPHESAMLSELSRRFHLSRRERETVQHLVRGLTTKEVALQMQISPNTVKQFVRLTMSKMGVTTRSGIVGKIIVR